MNAVPVEKLADIEQELVQEVVRIEQLHLQALAYDTTNFYTHIASTNLRPKLPQRGKNKQGRHDLRQMGLALVVDQVTRLPLATSCTKGTLGYEDLRGISQARPQTFAGVDRPTRST